MASFSELMNALARDGAAALADASVKSAIVLLVAAIAAHALRGASAAVRHRVWSLGLCGALLMPLLSWTVPQLQLPLLPAKATQAETDGKSGGVMPWERSQQTIAVASVGREANEETRGIHPEALSIQRLELAAATNSIRSEKQAALPNSRPDEASLASNQTAASLDFRVYVLGVWLAGLMIVAAPLAAGFGVNWLLLRKSRRLTQARWLQLIAELSARIGLTRTVAAFESPQPVVPMTWGFLRPRVLVPESWRDWPEERQRCVLLHELAHVKRLDVVFQIIGRLAAALYWFNPLAWCAVRQLRVERELACDDCVLASGERPSDYARELLKIARLYRLPPLAAGVAMAHSARLDQRVLRILDQARSRLPMSPNAARGLLFASAALVLGVAATSLVERSTSAVAREQATAATEVKTDNSIEVSRGQAAVRGVVLKPNGEPAAGARVYALEVESSPYLGNEKVRVLAEAVTANDGAFSMSYMEPEKTDQRGVNQFARVHHSAQFVATADGYAIGLANGDNKRDSIRIQLAQPQALNGRLIDLEGRPLTGAELHVKAIAQAGEPLDGWFLRAKANPRPDEQFAMKMAMASNERQRRPVSFPSKEGAALAATSLAPTVTTDRTAVSIPNIGPDRLVVLEVIAPTAARMMLKMVSHRGPDVYDAYPDPRLHDRMIHGADATIAIGPAAAVKGLVADAETGQPIAGCRVEVTQVAGSLMAIEDFAHTTTDEAGRYVLNRLPPDPPNSRGYRLRFTPPAGAPYFSTDMQVRIGGDSFETAFDVRLPRARLISGRIADDATGRPVRALVGYLPTLDNKSASAYPNFQAGLRTVDFDDFRWTEPDGSFRVPAINGRGVLCVAAERTAAYALAGHADRIEGLQEEGDKFGVYHLLGASMCNEFREVNLTGKDADPMINVALRSLSRRTVRLVDAQGQPVVGCLAAGQMPDIPFAARQSLSFYPSCESAETEVVGLEVESPRVLAIHQPEQNLGAVAVLRDEDPAREPIAITLQPCGRIHGRVFDASGKPAPGRYVYAKGLPPVELPKPKHSFRPASFTVYTEYVKTDADGRFEIRRGVVPGVRYEVAVREDDGAQDQPDGEQRAAPPKKETPVVEPGQTVDVGDLGNAAPADAPAAKPAPAEQANGQSAETFAVADESESVGVRGRVVGPDDEPLPGVTIAANAQGFPTGPLTTDQLGRFVVRGDKAAFERAVAENPRMVATIYAIKEGLASDWRTLLMQELPGSNLEFKLTKEITVEGQIVSAEGTPLPDVEVTVKEISKPKGVVRELLAILRGRGSNRIVYNEVTDQLQSSQGTAKTDAQGRFQWPKFGADRVVELSLEGKGVANQRIVVITREPPATSSDATKLPDGVHYSKFVHIVPASRVLRGVVRDKSTRQPLAGVALVCYANGERMTTQSDGRFEFAGCVKATEYSLETTATGQPYFGQSVSVKDTKGLDPIEVVIEMQRGVTLRGKAIDEEGPVAGSVEYEVLYPNEFAQRLGDRIPWPCSSAPIQPDGSYELQVLPGPGVVAVRTAPSARAHNYVIPRIDMKRLTEILGSETAAPVQSEDHLSVHRGGPGIGGFIVSSYQALTLINPAPDAKELTQDLQAKSGVKLAGRVLSPEGKPLMGVMAAGLNPRFLELDRIIGNEFTAFALQKERPRRLTFYHAEERWGAVFEADATTIGPIDVKLARCGSVRGRLLDKAGEPLASALVTLNRDRYRGQNHWSARTDDQGRFEIHGLIPGATYDGSTGVDVKSYSVIRSLVVKAGEAKELGDVTVNP